MNDLHSCAKEKRPHIGSILADMRAREEKIT